MAQQQIHKQRSAHKGRAVEAEQIDLPTEPTATDSDVTDILAEIDEVLEAS